ncbi:hypothetical protein QAD02_004963 [Eretmocerus hayati]|uniref:Uncharacterized protein n=1 Tax=Eretmocerus hayati TaxID=131215 RepID=A0ACC2NRE5_9HYME|nr:hypothetical protein QAD02_004963 [Eretmocerus hayati]
MRKGGEREKYCKVCQVPGRQLRTGRLMQKLGVAAAAETRIVCYRRRATTEVAQESTPIESSSALTAQRLRSEVCRVSIPPILRRLFSNAYAEEKFCIELGLAWVLERLFTVQDIASEQDAVASLRNFPVEKVEPSSISL